MGIVFGEVVFKGKAPDLTCIVDKITELSGLSVSIEEFRSDTGESFHDFHARLSFSSVPNGQLELYAYHSGAIREFYEEYGDFDTPTITSSLQGLDEPTGTQAVHLRIYIGQEPTLFYITIFALEALGGFPKHPLSDTVRHKYRRTLTQSQLHQRSLQNDLQILLVWLVGVILLPILIPLWLLQSFCLRLKLPKIIRKAQNDLNNRGGVA